MAIFSFVYHGYSPTTEEEFCEQGLVNATSYAKATEKVINNGGYDDKDEPLSIWINDAHGINEDVIYWEDIKDALSIKKMKNEVEFLEKHILSEQPFGVILLLNYRTFYEST